MSSNFQSYSYSYSSSSTSTSNNGGPPQSTTYAERSFTDNTGTTTERVRQLPGQQPVYESSSQGGGRRVGGGGATTSSQNRITDVTDADQKQEQRMEGGYIKREGGA
ncbi:hypothetical protein E0Z10_g1286 [Xylaria hypoxylon]|uniref:Uncharacterized protein n=1 Tax=Xylaria hypoxylon TaxID=37992 RepID=A0A4Z0ZF34_9PEZI|nr:hypothetical protein E0Z10_g1286 [Xylaria hypoxylon]